MIDTVDAIFRQLNRDIPEVSFRLRLWDGSERSYGQGDESFVLTVGSEDALADILTRGSLGFGEAYMDGRVDVEGDLQAVVRFAFHPAVRELHLRPRDKAKILAMYARHRNSMKKARENIQHHYDLGNDFYRLWLDESMTYSCAYWDQGCQSLEEAQRAKYEHICRKLQLRAGERLVDIGCGWGGMLGYAATNHGIEGIGYTLSEEQHAYANERFQEDGLYPKVRVELRDYREATGAFDKFVSIGMFEHVGKEFYGQFFAKVDELLVPGGLGVLHTIGKDRESETDPWIARYIFPGGFLPTLAQIAHHVGLQGLGMMDVENLRPHYARTLDAWAERFEAHLDEVASRFDERFIRMWRFYLNACSAGFKWGDIRVFQATFSKGIRADLPLTRAHLYVE